MEQARCWMWPKRKLDLMMISSPHHHHHHHLLTYPPSANPSSSSNADSWEEQAFAEDAAAGALRGCVWPPRSYTCSFCRRDFRSAQALGGHMNVHRRDRARLKQSSPPEGEGGNNNNHNNAANPTTVPLEAQYTPPRGSSGGSLLYSHNSPDSDHWIRVSTNIQEQYKNTNGLSAWSTLSGFGLTQDAKNGEKKELKVLIDLRKSTSIEDEEENNLKILDSSDQDVSSCKRRKIDENPTFGLLSKPGSEILSNPIEELDLELRLGSDPPKVK